jgi:hypothetical protein
MIAFLLFLLDIVHSMRVSLCWKMQHMVRTWRTWGVYLCMWVQRGVFAFPSWRSGVCLTILIVVARVLSYVDNVIPHVLVLVLLPEDGTEEYILSLFCIFNALPSTASFYMSCQVKSQINKMIIHNIWLLAWPINQMKLG